MSIESFPVTSLVINYTRVAKSFLVGDISLPLSSREREDLERQSEALKKEVTMATTTTTTTSNNAKRSRSWKLEISVYVHALQRVDLTHFPVRAVQG